MKDLISREALAQELTVEMVKCIRMSEETKGTMAERVLNRVLEAPTVDAVEVVRAKWVDSKRTPHSQCPVCGEWVDVKKKSNYCPNCGARMDGE